MRGNKTLEKLVIKEATNLRIHATKEERDRLNLGTLDGEKTHKCIYGQMTGSCDSNRANELIVLCAPNIYLADKEGDIFNGKLGGKPRYTYMVNRLSFYVSPIEKYIYWNNPKTYFLTRNVENLVNYIKGNINELVFE